MGNTLLFFHNKKSDEYKELKGLKKSFNFIKEYKANLKFNDYINDFYNKWKEIFELRKLNNKEYPIDSYLQYFLDKYQINGLQNYYTEIIARYYSYFIKYLDVKKNTKNILKNIKKKNYQIAIISNTYIYDEIMISCFKKKGLSNFIDFYFFSYSIQISKPDINIFLEAIKKTNADINNSFMIGDNLNSDIKPAKEIGLKTIWINSNYKKNNNEIIPDYELSSLNDLMNLII